MRSIMFLLLCVLKIFRYGHIFTYLEHVNMLMWLILEHVNDVVDIHYKIQQYRSFFRFLRTFDSTLSETITEEHGKSVKLHKYVQVLVCLLLRFCDSLYLKLKIGIHSAQADSP